MPYLTMQGSFIMNIKSGLGYCLFKQSNAGIKRELMLTNRSTSSSIGGK